MGNEESYSLLPTNQQSSEEEWEKYLQENPDLEKLEETNGEWFSIARTVFNLRFTIKHGTATESREAETKLFQLYADKYPEESPALDVVVAGITKTLGGK